MEEVGWKKDEKLYLIFTCSKCKQYIYVKTLQKTKRCLRCGRQHKVLSIMNSGEIVKGITEAVEMVKTRQNELAIRETGNVPDFRADNDFTVKSEFKTTFDNSKLKDNNDLSSRFKKMLQEISESYNKFPFYVLEIMAENYAIPLSRLKFLIKGSLTEGFLLLLEDNSYGIKS